MFSTVKSNTNTVTWVPGTSPQYDSLFESLRQQQYSDHSHRLWQNYNAEHFTQCSALTIHFGEHGQPEVCSSVLKRSCWPSTAYRILNRMWKVNPVRKVKLDRVSDSVGHTIVSQIQWLKTNTDANLMFISREVGAGSEKFMQWAVQNFDTHFGLNFTAAQKLYLTCDDVKNAHCWQRIWYIGQDTVLQNWSHCESC